MDLIDSALKFKIVLVEKVNITPQTTSLQNHQHLKHKIHPSTNYILFFLKINLSYTIWPTLKVKAKKANKKSSQIIQPINLQSVLLLQNENNTKKRKKKIPTKIF